MQELLTGIYTQFSSTPHSSFYNDIGGRLYLEEVEQDTEYPYAVYRLLNNTHTWTFDSNYEDSYLEFILVSDSTAGAGEILNMYKHCDNLFDNAAISVSGYQRVGLNRETNFLSKIPSEVADKSLWQMNIEFRALIRK